MKICPYCDTPFKKSDAIINFVQGNANMNMQMILGSVNCQKQRNVHSAKKLLKKHTHIRNFAQKNAILNIVKIIMEKAIGEL